MAPQIPPDLLTRARQILLPLVSTSDEREALLTDAFYLLPDSRLYHQIKRDGTPVGFTTLCFKTLMDYGCVHSNRHALSQLLGVARMYCGIDKHPEIDELMTIANTLCVEEVKASEATPITPVALPAPMQTMNTPRDERRPTVFVSYSHADDAFAQKLFADLNAAGHACWIDTSAIKGGADWQKAICDGINLSYALAVVCTHKSLESEYVWDEIQWARTRRKHIVPLLLEDVTIDDRFFGLHRYQGIRFDLLTYEAALTELMAALPAAPNHDPSALPRVPSRREHELAYLDRLRFEDFRLEKFELAEYAALAGVSQRQRDVRDGWETLAMQQEFSVIRTVKREQDESEGPQESFTDAVGRITELRRVVVLGEPGAGKTHTLRAIAKPLYTAALVNPKVPIPVLVKLGNWDKPDEVFEQFLRRSLGELGAYLDDLFEEVRVVLLLDGLNEFPADQREKKYPQVEAFIKAHPDVMAVVTCREADYPVSLHLNKVLIRPLDPLRIRDFARRALRAKGEEEGDRFFWKLAGDEQLEAVWGKWERAGADLNLFWDAPDIPRESPNVYGVTSGIDRILWREHVRNTASIMRLASNPYMLRMLLDVYIQYKGVLPANRGQLFEQFVNVLLEREKLAKIASEAAAVTLTQEGRALVTGLQRVAFEMQVRRDGRKVSAGTSLELAAVRDIMSDRLLYLGVSTSILNSSDEVRFAHQLMQEYFAAKYLDTAIISPRSEKGGAGGEPLRAVSIWKPENWWERTNWEEAVILLAGLHSEDCTPVVEWVNAANPEVAAHCVMLSGAKLADATCERLRAEWILRLTDLKRNPNPRARAAVGRALGLTNWDDRKGVNVIIQNGVQLPDIDWVHIPAGEFTMGHEEENDNPPRVLTLDYDYDIARYPVTYAQYQTFIDDSQGYRDPRWWRELAMPEGHNAASEDQAFKYRNHSREHVSWYDAVAFCRWFSDRLGIEVRLPTEFEWEKAARAKTGWRYPYADEFDAAKGNTVSTGIEQTSAVGIFPAGDTPHWRKPISDLSGNVWEWCLTDYLNPQIGARKEDMGSNARRVLRGGSWYLSQDSARAASRYSNDPDDRDGGLGFRLVRAPSQRR